MGMNMARRGPLGIYAYHECVFLLISGIGFCPVQQTLRRHKQECFMICFIRYELYTIT